MTRLCSPTKQGFESNTRNSPKAHNFSLHLSYFGGPLLKIINVIKGWAADSCACAPQIKSINLVKDSWPANAMLIRNTDMPRTHAFASHFHFCQSRKPVDRQKRSLNHPATRKKLSQIFQFQHQAISFGFQKVFEGRKQKNGR